MMRPEHVARSADRALFIVQRAIDCFGHADDARLRRIIGRLERIIDRIRSGRLGSGPELERAAHIVARCEHWTRRRLAELGIGPAELEELEVAQW